jgi:hypothetical protein
MSAPDTAALAAELRSLRNRVKGLTALVLLALPPGVSAEGGILSAEGFFLRDPDGTAKAWLLLTAGVGLDRELIPGAIVTNG